MNDMSPVKDLRYALYDCVHHFSDLRYHKLKNYNPNYWKTRAAQ